uniref:Uncharacterized protein n=1 Tax=Tanacetum cinerariifolium TaxID=118510 RepID=A0A699WHG2_TANCI|nr:hypothetical protein [Tanacetum cinerariifolium]
MMAYRGLLSRIIQKVGHQDAFKKTGCKIDCFIGRGGAIVESFEKQSHWRRRRCELSSYPDSSFFSY